MLNFAGMVSAPFCGVVIFAAESIRCIVVDCFAGELLIATDVSPEIGSTR